ncbi:NUMOD4 domain-containing protein [Humibacter ginsenosidimutans]|uniref:HNH endonuclease n=1 Tax=Humibacter ginsenosidimutans TaxID=2599293 RepID=A0A5B8M732_9MICO|nr:NUMOD4 domain-containing protein [Humibacter ginsenosidimutans]QDZ15804.1 hypothetical protein FPZ11_14445 [Humibacter ginsenosidimutans]
MQLDDIQWRPVGGYEGLYEVSNDGRVRRPLDHPKRPGFVLSPAVMRSGHRRVRLLRDGVPTSYLVHRIEAIAFLGEPEPGQYACHNDGNPANNSIENIRWDSPSGNARDMLLHGTHPQAFKTHCPRGHEYTEENTKHTAKGRSCMQCHSDLWSRRSERSAA